MTRILSALLLLFPLLSAGAQAGPISWVNVMTDSLETTQERLKAQFQWVQDFQNKVALLQNAVKQAQDAALAVQYQVKAVQSLQAGSWDGFVQAYNYQTAVFGQFRQTIDDFGNYNDENIKAMLQDPNYKTFAQRIKMLDESMRASNGIVQTTNMLVQNTAANMKASGDLVNQSRVVDGVNEQAQIASQQMAILASELADIQQVLSATLNANYVEQNHVRILLEQQKEVAKGMNTSNGGRGIYDQSNADDHWNLIAGTNWSTGDE